MWVAELAWPDQGVAVVLPAELQGGVEERDRCVDAYTAAGWHVREACDWNVTELVDLVTVTIDHPQEQPERPARDGEKTKG